jgi:hypothetical protein
VGQATLDIASSGGGVPRRTFSRPWQQHRDEHSMNVYTLSRSCDHGGANSSGRRAEVEAVPT